MESSRPQNPEEKKEVPSDQLNQWDTPEALIHILLDELNKCSLHYLLKNRIIASGHTMTGSGLCSGVSGMSLQNWLLARSEGVRKLKSRIDSVLDMKEDEFKKINSEEKQSENLTDIKALFDGIHSYQETNLFVQSDKKKIQSPLDVSPVILSKELQEKGNLVLAGSFDDVYHQDNLVECLDKLKKTQENHSDQTLGFRLGDALHSIFVGYDITDHIWMLVDVENLQKITFENTDAVARQIISGFSPAQASDFAVIRLSEEKLATDLSGLRDRLKACCTGFSCKIGYLNLYYNAHTGRFTLKNAKQERCPAIFTIDIYSISSIQKILEKSLNDLIKPAGSPVLKIKLQHLTHEINIQYHRENKTWILLDEKGDPCGQTKKTDQMTQWVMSEFLTSDNISIHQIDVKSDVDSFFIRDKNIDDIINELDRNHGFSTQVITQEKALACDFYDGTWLYSAARNGNHDLVIRLLKAGADVDKTNCKGNTSLSAASGAGFDDIVAILLNHPAVYDPRALVTAVFNGHIRVVEIFIKHHVNVNEQGNAETTPPVVAAQNGRLEIMKLLFANGATNTADNRNVTPLNAAAAHGKIEVVRFLLERQDTDVNQSDKFGRSPLFMAAMLGDLPVVKLLLENNARINQPKTDNSTPLAIATEKGHKDVAQFLQERGAVSRFCLKESPDFELFLKKSINELNTQEFQSLFDALIKDGVSRERLAQIVISIYRLDDSRDVARYRLAYNFFAVISPAELATHCLSMSVKSDFSVKTFMQFIKSLDGALFDYKQKFVEASFSNIIKLIDPSKYKPSSRELYDFLKDVHLYLSEDEPEEKEDFTRPCHPGLLIQLKEFSFLDQCIPFIKKLLPQDIAFLFHNNENPAIFKPALDIIPSINIQQTQALLRVIFGENENIPLLFKLPVEQIKSFANEFNTIQPTEKFARDCMEKIKKYLSTANNPKRVIAAAQAVCLLTVDPVDRTKLADVCQQIEADHGTYKLNKSDLASYINDYLKKTAGTITNEVQELRDNAFVHINALADMEEKEDRQEMIRRDREEQLKSILKNGNTPDTVETLKLFMESLTTEIIAKMEENSKSKGEWQPDSLFSLRSYAEQGLRKSSSAQAVTISLSPEQKSQSGAVPEQPSTVEKTIARKRSKSG